MPKFMIEDTNVSLKTKIDIGKSSKVIYNVSISGVWCSLGLADDGAGVWQLQAPAVVQCFIGGGSVVMFQR